MKYDLTNQRFGKLVALHAVIIASQRTEWVCQCDCGKQIQVRYDRLLFSTILSCGCHCESVGASDAT